MPAADLLTPAPTLTPPRPAPGLARHAERNLPRYTSYPTALAFGPEVDAERARRWAAEGSAAPISVYCHVPFCRQLCWYCGCHTTVPNGYARVAHYVEDLHREIDLWSEALGPYPGTAHLHFGGGSPNALSPEDFLALVQHLKQAFRVRPDAEVAVELDPRDLDEPFVRAIGAAGVTRASLGVQTFDPAVQARINRIQPFEQVAWAVSALREAGVTGVNFDLMYGLPGQTPASVRASAEAAAALEPDRLSVFGYAHVPWFKKHQKMVDEAELADLAGRWAQADAADGALDEAGYERIGLDHYARPQDSLSAAAKAGTLRRNFQGYTTDEADVLLPLGASSIGRFGAGFVQNARATDAWSRAVRSGELPVDRGVAVDEEDRLRAAVIERLMCGLQVDLAQACAAADFPPGFLDSGLEAARALQADGLCQVKGRVVTVAPEARRLVRAVAACFDAHLSQTHAEAQARHSKAV